MVRVLPATERCWLSVELPGYREHPAPATYSQFPADELPPIEHRLDDGLGWLLALPPVAGSLADRRPGDPEPTRPANRDELSRLSVVTASLPGSFVAFMASDGPRRRIRSATACYLDLADRATPVAGGGTLIHFLSDQQWALHWLLFVGPDGSEAVLGTDQPIGFLDPGEPYAPLERFDPASPLGCICAESFTEFLYRYWIENEIWFRLAAPGGERLPLSAEMLAYVEHYRS
jgi:hypothetical protein